MISDKDLDDLITNLAGYNLKFNSIIMLANKQIALLRNALNELKERRESDIIPATKFLNQELRSHIQKVTEESNEVIEAALIYFEQRTPKNIDKLIEELIDVQMAAETAITKLAPDVKVRWFNRRQVRDKNNKRGYYEET